MQLITVHEHVSPVLTEAQQSLLSGVSSIERKMPGKQNDDSFCYRIGRSGDVVKIDTSYYIGVDWLTDDVALQVLPKLDNESFQVDHMQMLMDALHEIENTKHLDGLVSIDFNARPIPIKQEKEDLLTPFLVAQFVMTLKAAARHGLRRSYYLVEENLRSKVKGKILISQNVRKNLCRGNITDNVCRHQEFGLDNPENRLLKHALRLSCQLLSSIQGGIDVKPLLREISIINPYFKEVSDDYNPADSSLIGTNPIFKDYYKALELARLVIKRSTYGMNRSSSTEHTTPPYWIDMSKLFELYVLKRLREHYVHSEVLYQEKINGYFPDYLVIPSNGEEPFIIDAKYKPLYSSSYDMDDVRQVSGYARMKKVFDIMNIEDKGTMIKCLIIYPDQSMPERLEGRLDLNACHEIKLFYDIYTKGIKVPAKKITPDILLDE